MKVISNLLGLAAAALLAYGLWVVAVIVFVFWWENYDPQASCEGKVEYHVERLYPVPPRWTKWEQIEASEEYKEEKRARWEDSRNESIRWLSSRGYQKAMLAYDVSWRNNGSVISHIIKIKTATTLTKEEKIDKVRGVQRTKRHKEAVNAFFEEAGDVNLDQWCIDHNALEALREEEAAL